MGEKLKKYLAQRFTVAQKAVRRACELIKKAFSTQQTGTEHVEQKSA